MRETTKILIGALILALMAGFGVADEPPAKDEEEKAEQEKPGYTEAVEGLGLDPSAGQADGPLKDLDRLWVLAGLDVEKPQIERRRLMGRSRGKRVLVGDASLIQPAQLLLDGASPLKNDRQQLDIAGPICLGKHLSVLLRLIQ